MLVSGSWDQSVGVYEFNPSVTGSNGGSGEWSEINQIYGFHGKIYALAWDGTNDLLAVGSQEGAIRLFTVSVLKTSSWSACYSEANGNANDGCCDGQALGCSGLYIATWRDLGLSRRRQVHALLWHSGKLWSGWADGKVRRLSYSSGTSPPLSVDFEYEPSGRVYRFHYLPQTDHMAHISPDYMYGEIYFLNGAFYKSMEQIRSHPPGTSLQALTSINAFSTDFIYTAGNCSSIRIMWGATSPLETRALLWDDGLTGPVTAIASLQSEWRIVTSAGGRFTNWDILDTQDAPELIAHDEEITDMKWIEELGQLITASVDKKVKAWYCRPWSR
eukprot:gnl/TRDRNA2_/TRDRNA2_138122_c0_seq2.p1 gnl/TRDRNA2_/TRDRNA2_138122_c0~~gnl/TRDRNA2_/TRDRNA2_138122_c0_seq2.p1  ORF type:complete len:343 (+),score=18.81 gnl/TRDRNA2_/TRDRNA2_138122_c0_seq2:39-1031(+)